MDDSYAIQLARTGLREGYNTADVERILGLYSDHVSLFSEGQPSLGRAEARAVLRARLEEIFARFKVCCAPAGIDVLVFGDMAVDYGWQDLSLTPFAGGLARKHRTRYLHLWKKEKDGCWRIALLIDNLDQPLQLAEAFIAALRNGTVDPVNCARVPEGKVIGDRTTRALGSFAELGVETLQQTLTET